MLAILTSHPIQYQAPLWRALAADGRVAFEVWFLTPHALRPSHDPEFGRTFAWDEDLTAGYPHRFVPIEPDWSIERFRGVKLTESWASQFRQHGVTALWVEGWRFSVFWSAIHTARSAGIPVWLRGENHDLAPLSLRTRLWKRPLMGYLFSQIDAFLAIGSANRRFYRSYGVDTKRLHPAPYCVDNHRWRETAARLAPERAAIRAAWGIAPEAACVLFAGKLIPKKRPADLVAAARLVQATHPRLHLLFAGDGELRRDLEDTLRQPGSPPSTFTGFLNLNDIPRAFVAADVLVLPSDFWETWGLVVNEALAADVPCIVSDRCGCAEDLARPIDPALVFRAGDCADLARALRAWLTTPPPATALRAIVDRHDPSVTVATAAQLFSSVPGP